MRHDDRCEVGLVPFGPCDVQRLDCECATRAFLEQATPEERRDYDARNVAPNVRPLLDVSATQWRRRA